MGRKESETILDAQGPAPPARNGAHNTSRQARNGTTKSRSSELADYQPPGLPKYLRLVRKEARLTADQFEALMALSRRFNRRKPAGVGERMTENTLIRVAVELLLAQADRLDGTTEDELLASLR